MLFEIAEIILQLATLAMLRLLLRSGRPKKDQTERLTDENPVPEFAEKAFSEGVLNVLGYEGPRGGRTD